VLLQAHSSRRGLAADLARDQDYISENAVRLLQAMVDVVSSNSWLHPALAAMELSQMVTQAVWDSDPILKQLPHFTEERIQRCKDKGVESVFDLLDLEEANRNELLQMTKREIQNVAVVCNRYPNIDLTYEMEPTTVASGASVAVNVNLQREMEEDEELGPVHAPFFPKEKVEGWWLVVGDPKNNQLLAVKRLNLQRRSKVKLEFQAPAPGDYTYTLYFMCDSYTGCDQEYEIKLHVDPVNEVMDE